MGINEICRYLKAPLQVFHAVRRVRRSGAEQQGKRKRPALLVKNDNVILQCLMFFIRYFYKQTFKNHSNILVLIISFYSLKTYLKVLEYFTVDV